MEEENDKGYKFDRGNKEEDFLSLLMTHDKF